MSLLIERSHSLRKDKIYSIIRKNRSNTEFTVQWLARDMDISSSYLYEIVYKHFNMSPQRLIETIRLEKAIFLIAQGMKLIRLYRKLGYDNVRTFRQAFYKRLKMNYSKCRIHIEKGNNGSKEEAVQQLTEMLWATDDGCFNAGLSIKDV